MAILGRKKNTEKEPKAKAPKNEVAPANVASEVSSEVFSSESHILIRPRVTEKASERAMNANVYIFDVARSASKKQIAHAVQGLYKVKAVKVAVVTVPSKKVFVRGKAGQTNKGKKAYVYLKRGDKIEFV